MIEKKNNAEPPRSAQNLLEKIYRAKKKYHRTGDLNEVFYDKVDNGRVFSAWLWYWSQVIKAVYYSTRNLFYWKSNMLKNYLKIALRNILKQKMYSVINISGLALGMAAAFLILIWINDEISFDNFHENGDNIYRIVGRTENGIYSVTDGAFGAALKKDLPEVSEFTRVFPANRRLLTSNNKSNYYIERAVDPSFFRIFSFPFLKGDPVSSLSDPGSIIISERICNDLFDGEDPIGKTVILSGNTNLIITGLIKDVPKNSHLEFDYLLPISDNMPERFFSWEMLIWHTYLLMQDNSDMVELEKKVNDCYSDNTGNSRTSWILQPLEDIHLHSTGYQYDEAVKGDIKDVYFFFSLSVFIILIASINFVNLSTARSAARAREVCMRKVSGAKRSEIIMQFFGESISLTLIAMLISVLLVFTVFPYFAGITGKSISAGEAFNMKNISGILLIALFSGLFSGIYPSLYMSSFQPVKVLKGVISAGRSRSVFRKALVVIQSALTVTLVIGTIIVSKQLNFIRNIDLGFNEKQIIYFELRAGAIENFDAFSEALLQIPGVKDYTEGFVPSGIGSWTTPAWEGKRQNFSTYMYRAYVAQNYLDFYEMNMAKGRFFSKDLSSDTLNYVVNEAAVRAMGIDDPLGKRFSIHGRTGSIIGVVKDFHYRSLHNTVEPFIFLMSPAERYMISVKLSPEDIKGTLSRIEAVWERFTGDFPFNPRFLDETIEEMYRSEKQAGDLFMYFTGLAIFIAGLGLFGMASYLAEQRTREIGIRKVFGAQPGQVVRLLSSDFTKWILTANIIAFPVGWYMMDKWLMGFAFKTEIDILSFLIAAILSFVVALSAVSLQSIRAASSDPVNTLHRE